MTKWKSLSRVQLCDPKDWNSPGWYTGVGIHSLLQGIFPTQGSNLGLPHCRQILYHWDTGEALLKCLWASKNWCFWTMVLEKTLESPLNCKEIQPVHPIGDQSWVFIGKTDVEAETPIFWPPDGKSWLIWKDPDVGRDWGQEEKGTTEDEMVGWHHRLNGHEFG